MFELSFGKMMIIAVVALIVLGPERLPKVARTIGHLLGRARSYANQVKQDIDREMQMDELRKLQEQAKDAARSFETAVNDAGRAVETQASQVETQYNSLASQTENSIANPAASANVNANALADEVKALEQSIAEQALSQNSTASTSVASVKPMITTEQMNSSLAPAWPAADAANAANAANIAKANASQKVA
jgi:sec-independent protein translocase protein TatB